MESYGSLWRFPWRSSNSPERYNKLCRGRLLINGPMGGSTTSARKPSVVATIVWPSSWPTHRRAPSCALGTRLRILVSSSAGGSSVPATLERKVPNADKLGQCSLGGDQVLSPVWLSWMGEARW